MILFAFRGAKSHEWTFCDQIKVEDFEKVINAPRMGRPNQ